MKERRTARKTESLAGQLLLAHPALRDAINVGIENNRYAERSAQSAGKVAVPPTGFGRRRYDAARDRPDQRTDAENGRRMETKEFNAAGNRLFRAAGGDFVSDQIQWACAHAADEFAAAGFQRRKQGHNTEDRMTTCVLPSHLYSRFR